MSETLLGSIPVIGAIFITIASWFYMWGGRSGKWKRRFIGSLIAASAIWIESLILGVFNFLHLLAYPILITVFSLGYGAEIPLEKIIKRLIVVIGSLGVGILMCLTLGGNAWWILPIQVLIAIGSVILGVKNPIPAAAEEFFVCFLLTFTNIMYPFVRSL